MNDQQPAIACNLGALSRDEQVLLSTTASRVSARFREILETADGYSARLDPDAAIVRDALDWILLEHRCCPFLRLELCLDPGDVAAWLRFSGGPGVKDFLAVAVLKPPAAKSPP